MTHATTPPTIDPTALVIGEALIDVVHTTDGSVEEHPGGSPANVALTLGRLGRSAQMLTWTGADTYGDLIRTWLSGSGVVLVPGSDGAASTSIATARLDANGAAQYEFDLLWNLPAKVDVPASTVVAHTGSIAAVLEPGAAAVRRLLDAARPTATITYDPNIRPSLMGSPSDVRTLVEDIVRGADVVKVSDEDIEWLYPGADLDTIAAQWRASGPAIVVITYGGKGAVATTADDRIEVAAPTVTVADTVGAGDSFMGALIHGLWSADLLGGTRRAQLHTISTDTLTEILVQCVRVAAITVSRPGANPPRLHELAH